VLRALLITIASSIVLVLLLRWLPPPTSAFMIAARAQAVFGGDFRYRNEYDWVPLEAISPHAAMAAIAAEDQLFPFHTGFDFESIRKAVKHNAKGRRVRGASTITQQTAKNLFLWSGRSWVRKGLEVYFTVLIEALWPKDRILEVYLNLAQFGRGIYGVQAASKEFFDKDAAKLTRRQSALLAAVLPNPIKLRAAAPSPYVLRRSERIMGQMRALGGAAYLRQLDDAEPR
jgi:monofunctional biosynthetic peptidoglycan transglycosylase